MQIRVNTGLMSRIRAILVYLQKAREQNETLEVQWTLNQYCDTPFHELFQPTEDLVFIDGNGLDPVDDTLGQYRLPKIWLRPSDNISDQLADLWPTQSYSAIHIRRTDHTALLHDLGKRQTSDGHFMMFVYSVDIPVYLATDNRDTQLKYKRIFGDQIFWYENISNNDRLRQTSVQAAAIDFWLCVCADGDFMGSHFSTFSRMIDHFRNTSWITL